MTELATLLDREALDASDGPVGRTSVSVPRAWLARGDTIDVTVPVRVACARCGGGGCDRCERRGGHRIEGDERARRVRLTLPKVTDGPGVVVRLVTPFGEDAELEQLIVEVGVAESASPGCRRVAHPASASRGFLLVAVLLALAIATALAAAIHR